MTADHDMPTWRWLMLIATLLLVLFALLGCGRKPEAAKAQRMSMQAVTAAAQLNADAEWTPEHRAKINTLLGESLRLQAPVLDGLELGEPVTVVTTVETAKADPQLFATAALMQADKARQEAEDAAFWHRIGTTIFSAISVTAQSTLGITLGSLGGSGLLGGAALWVMRMRKQLGAALQAATTFGDQAASLVEQTAPPEVQQYWATAKKTMAKAQDVLGVQPLINKARPVPTAAPLLPPVIAPAATVATPTATAAPESQPQR